MAKTDIRQYSTTAGNNTDIEGINIAEGWASANINNSLRALMAELKGFWDAGFGYASTETGNFTLDATDDQTATTNDNYGFVNVTAAATVTVPAATGVTANWGAIIHNSSAAATVSLARSSTDTINGATAVDIPAGWTALLKRVSSSAWRAVLMPAMDPIGAHTNALQPAFMATNAGGQDDNQTGDSTTYTLVLDTEIFDQNADYNLGTGTFTAPVTGRYLIGGIIALSGITGTDALVVEIVTSNRTYRPINTATVAVASAGGNLHLPFVVLADMDAADTATMTVQVTGGAKVVDIRTTSVAWAVLLT